MKINTTSDISVNEQNWRKIKNKIDISVSNFLKEHDLHDVKFYTDVEINLIRKRLRWIPNLTILINCWHKSSNSYIPLGQITKDQTQALANNLNKKFVDTKGNNTYFYTWNLEFDSNSETYVCAEFPIDTKLIYKDS